MNLAKLDQVTKFRDALQRHVEEHAYSNVKFVECTNPANNPDLDDHSVAYEAEFEPCDLEHAYLKIAITDEGAIGLGFETRMRLAQRFETRLWTSKEAFAAGCEPSSITTRELISFIRLVAQGGVMLQLGFGWGLLGGEGTRAVVGPLSYRHLGATRSGSLNWLKVLTDEQRDASWRRIVAYEPW